MRTHKPIDVRYWAGSRKHLLAASISGFDPKQTYATLDHLAGRRAVDAAVASAIKDNRTFFLIGSRDGLAARFYFVNMGLEGIGGVAAAGEILNVSQTFQPAGRFSLANSP